MKSDVIHVTSMGGGADEALKQAEVVLAHAESEASAAKNTMLEAKDQLAAAALERDAAIEAAEQTAAELAALRERFAPVLRAVNVRDAAKETLDMAEAALITAKAELSKVQEALAQAQRIKAATADRLFRATGLTVEEALIAAIEDPDFAYLNEYVSEIEKADSASNEAKAELDAANTELTLRVTERENAQRAYIAAVADLAILQDRESMLRKDTNLSTPKASANASEPVPTRLEAKDSFYSTSPVKTGDMANVMALLAGLLASTGFMGVAFKMRKEDKDKNNR